MQVISIEVRGFHKLEAKGALENVLNGIKGIKRYELDNPNKRILILAEDDVNPKDIKDALMKNDFSVGVPTSVPYKG